VLYTRLCIQKVCALPLPQCVPQESGLALAKLSLEQRVLLLQIVLKSADLGHVAEDLDVHIK